MISSGIKSLLIPITATTNQPTNGDGQMARDLYQEITDKILAELENGALPWIKPWSTMGVGGGGVFPCNAATNRPYSGCNVVLLWMTAAANGWTSPRYLTYKQAQEAGGHVRKGEKGTAVIFVKPLRVKDEKNEGKEKTISMMKAYTVFNIEQCDDLPDRITQAPAPKVRNHDERMVEAEEFVQSTGAVIQHQGSQPAYSPAFDMIRMPVFESFKGGDHYYGTLFHELGHWTGHPTRLDRNMKNRFGDREYAAEELVAELTSAFLCAEFEIDGDLRHAGYIDAWISLLREDKKAFITAASKASQAAHYLRGLALEEPMAEAA